MKKILLFTLIIVSSFAFGQDSIPSIKFDILKTNYKDFIIVENNIYAITKGDSLVVWNIKNNKVSLKKTNVKVIAKNSKNEVCFGLSNGKVKTINNILLDQIPEKSFIYNLLFDNSDNLIIITNKSIHYNNQEYIPNKKSPFFWKSGYRRPSSNLIKPNVLFLDKEDKIWFGYDAGEWGGDMCFFDLKTKEFYCDDSLYSLYYDKYGYRPKNDSLELKAFPEKVKITKKDTLIKFPHNLYASHVKGIAQDENGNFFISESLMHFSVDGSITKLEKTQFVEFYKNIDLSFLLKNEIRINEYKNKEGKKVVYKHADIQEYLGPITFNSFNKSIYYYTNNGFYRIIEKNKFYTKELIIQPKLVWKAGLPQSVGYQMAIKKFKFLDKIRFVFLTSNNGIGYFDGEKVIYYK